MNINQKISLIVATIIIGIVVVITTLFFINQDFKEFILSTISKEETVYAKGYSKKAWDQVKKNDTKEIVIHLLGRPLKIYKNNDGTSSYYYTVQGPKDTNYIMRTIIFNEEGKVIKKIREFYID